MHFYSYIVLSAAVVAAIKLEAVGAGGNVVKDHCGLANADSHKYRRSVGDRTGSHYEFDVTWKVTCPWQEDTAIQKCTVYSIQGKKLAEAHGGGAKTKAFTAFHSETELPMLLRSTSLTERQTAEKEQKFTMLCYKFYEEVIEFVQKEKPVGDV